MRYRGFRAEVAMRTNEFAILKVIRENRDIQHSRLVEFLVKQDLMVKKTAEDALSRMIKEKRIQVIPVANRKHYRLPDDSMHSEIINERSLVETIPKMIDNMINDMGNKYKDLTLQDKASYSLTCVGAVLQQIHELLLFNIKSGLQKNRFSRVELDHKKRIKLILDIIKNDSDKDIIVPWIEYKIISRPMATAAEFTDVADRIKSGEFYL